MSTTISRSEWHERDDDCVAVLDSVLQIAMELAREGREGRCVGTIFVVGDPAVLRNHSRPLILDPLKGHDDSRKQIDDPEVRESLKELSQLDGAFLISRQGVAISAAQYLDVSAKDVRLGFGFGSRHMAGAAISQMTDSVAIVVSASSVVRVFERGECIRELSP